MGLVRPSFVGLCVCVLTLSKMNNSKTSWPVARKSDQMSSSMCLNGKNLESHFVRKTS